MAVSVRLLLDRHDVPHRDGVAVNCEKAAVVVLPCWPSFISAVACHDFSWSYQSESSVDICHSHSGGDRFEWPNMKFALRLRDQTASECMVFSPLQSVLIANHALALIIFLNHCVPGLRQPSRCSEIVLLFSDRECPVLRGDDPAPCTTVSTVPAEDHLVICPGKDVLVFHAPAFHLHEITKHHATDHILHNGAEPWANSALRAASRELVVCQPSDFHGFHLCARNDHTAGSLR
mmetsp:Transcript_30973/g.72672  ORF Transcript_30973/g.72672 Transcript_30973/m.72672 type:complete len:234 (+) Transcript_30973:489-1190(+)